MPARKKTVKRAIRRRTTRKRGGGGKKFFSTMLVILAFVLLYHFAGEAILYGIGFHPGSQGYVQLGEHEIMVSFIDVGQGDSILVRSRNNAVLIDGGEHTARNAVLNYLRSAGVRRLCYVVATHPHSDHIGGLVTVLGRLEVGAVIMPEVTHNTNTFERFLEAIENNHIDVVFPTPGQQIQAGILDFTVIAPPNPHPSNNLNNASVVMRLVHGQTSFLFTGDAERELEEWMVNSGQNIASNVLKVAHHGSRTSSIDTFLDAVNPSAAVISLGANNRYGHPHREVMDRLNARNIRIHRTDHMGTIRMITNGREIHLHH